MPSVRVGSAIFASALLVGLAAGAAAQGGPDGARPIVRDATRSDTSAAVRAVPPIPPIVGEVRELPRRTLPHRAGSAGPSGPDPVLQGPVTGTGIPATTRNFDGIGNRNGVLPPDPAGAAGPDHYVQVVNLSFAVWNKQGDLLLGPANTSTLWQGFGGPCQTENDGDPIVLYDHLAGRWLLSQFALPNFPLGPFYQCIAVSQTGDPTGAWHRYEFLISQNKMNDYPKFGRWPDAYYMAVNQFQAGSLQWGGQGVVAFERDAMLQGLPARMVYFDLDALDPNLGGMLPADLDGAVPPSGAPNVFVQIDDNAWGYSPDQLQLWEFQVDWATPASSTFTLAAALPTAAFDTNLCGYSRNCIPQPAGTALDALSDRLMYRLQYRNFGTHQALVTNHTVDVNGANHAGIRWYELRHDGQEWALHQQGTFAPDGLHRWMGSVAMDAAGNLALGYSVTGTTTFPSIRYTGRLAGDPLGELTLGEATLVAGAGVQQHSSGRWGDYSTLAVDPDGCTFWYTGEYYASTGSAPWRTRIGAFALAACGGGGNQAPAAQAVAASGNEDTVIAWTPSVSDPDGDPLTCAIVQAPAHGSATVAPTCTSGTYTPVADYHGPDAFTYRVLDGQGGSDTATVTVTVQPVNDAPTGVADSYSTVGGTTLVVVAPGVLGNDSDVDGDALSALGGSGPANGALALAANGSFTYTPTAGFSGLDSFTYRAFDGALTSALVTVAITVSAPTTVHVGDLAGASINSGSTWAAMVTITVHGATHAAVTGATVTGSWSAGASGSASCVTTASGSCAVSKSGLKKRTASVTFTVTGITAAGLTYRATDNHDPNGGSDGTRITVLKP